MKDPLNRTAQKNAPAKSIVVGDLVYRAAPQGDYMMEVQSISTGTHEGDAIFIWKGAVFKLEGSGAGPKANFLGDITAYPAGRGEWKIRTDDQITKGVPPDQAEFQYPVVEP